MSARKEIEDAGNQATLIKGRAERAEAYARSLEVEVTAARVEAENAGNQANLIKERAERAEVYARSLEAKVIADEERVARVEEEVRQARNEIDMLCHRQAELSNQALAAANERRAAEDLWRSRQLALEHELAAIRSRWWYRLFRRA
jgi:hypothetical protein